MREVSVVDNFLAVRNEMGETPLWDPDEQALYWVDIAGQSIHRYHPESGMHESYRAALPITALARRASIGWLAVTKSGLAFWDHAANTFTPIVDPFSSEPDFIFNDGVVDKKGRFLIGSFNQRDLDAPEGCLFRFDPDGSLHELDGGLKVPNGMGHSPDGTLLYVTEMFSNRILVYDYDTERGTVSNRRTFVDIAEADGMPDGLTVDSEGCVWSAHWEGWCVTRYNTEGKADFRLKLPVEIVTCVGFGGPDMDELYITTAWHSLDTAAKGQQPMAGDLFRIKSDTRGMVEQEFLG
jgi:sugar lactone lactonase YvrE